MSLDTDSVLRPSDYEFVRAQSGQLRRTMGIPVVFAGLRDGPGVRVTVSVGHRTSALKTIHVTPSRGLGGLSWQSREPMIVRGYHAASEITHDFDDQILGEGITDLVAAPFVVDGDVRGLIYAGYRGDGYGAPSVVDHLVRQADFISAELRTRDEVDRRVAALAARDHQRFDSDSSARWLTQLGAIAADSADPQTRRRLETLISIVTGPRSPHIELTRRQLQVLSLVELGLSNKDVAVRLGLTTETVKTYLRSAMVRLGARTRHEAVIKARCAGHTFRETFVCS
jgi:DNA-binding CsgD family transcriptional regulator